MKSSSVAGCWWFTPAILATWEAEIRRTVVRGQLRQSDMLISKTTRAKWTGGVAQAVEHLLCKHKSLIQIPVSSDRLLL
jgi:hypothetical protein